jgi:hypothetical protein
MRKLVGIQDMPEVPVDQRMSIAFVDKYEPKAPPKREEFEEVIKKVRENSTQVIGDWKNIHTGEILTVFTWVSSAMRNSFKVDYITQDMQLVEGVELDELWEDYMRVQ